MIFSVLFERRARETESHQQKDDPRDLQPELVHGAGERSKSSARSRHHGIECAAALHLLAGNPGHNSSLAPGGKFAHALDFNSLWRYNDPHTRERRTVPGIMASN